MADEGSRGRLQKMRGHADSRERVLEEQEIKNSVRGMHPEFARMIAEKRAQLGTERKKPRLRRLKVENRPSQKSRGAHA